MISTHELKNLLGSADEANNSVLTVYLDVDPAKAANANRGFEATLHRLLLASQPPVHGVAEAKRFIEAAERVQKFVASYEPQRRTLVAVYDQADRFFWVRELGIRLRDSAYWGVRPYLQPVADTIGEFDQYAVALVGDGRVRLFKIFLGEIEEYLGPSGNIVPSIERMILKEKIERLILAGPAETLSKLRRAIPKRMERMTIGCTEIPFAANPEAVLKTVLPIIEEFERGQEAQMVHELISAADATSRAVTGIGRTLEVLNEGAVGHLVYTEGMHSGGYACQQCNALFDQDHEVCVYCGSPLRVIDNLPQRMVDRAAEHGARIQQLRAQTAAGLAKVGGVGAFLKTKRNSRTK
jgi:hypothetical protein